jgi:hypothetical protein
MWLKASARDLPQPTSNIREIFSNQYFEDLRRLDLSRTSPLAPPGTWFQVSAEVINAFASAVKAVIDSYFQFLDADSIELFESLDALHSLKAVVMIGNSKNPIATQVPRTWNLFAGDGMIDQHKEDVDVLIDFLSRFNATAKKPIVVEDLQLWHPNIGFPIGNARITDAEMARSNPMLAIGKRLPSMPPGASFKGPVPSV